MTPSPEFTGRTAMAGIIPASCLALLTIGSVSFCGNADACFLPAALIIAITFSLIILIARPILTRE